MAAKVMQFPENNNMELGFTGEDRRSLNILENELKHVVEELRGLSVRIARLEEAKVSVRDIEQTYVDIDELRQQKADKGIAEATKVQMLDHEERIRAMEKRIWTWIGYGGAVAGIGSVIGGVLVKLLLR